MERIDGVRWHAISALLDQLLEADADERSLQLTKLEETDPALARSVAQLLSYQPVVESTRFLEGSFVLPALDPPAGDAVVRPAAKPRNGR